MADFTEIWELRNRLILDGLYLQDTEDPIDPLELERKITRLAEKYYRWSLPKPRVGQHYFYNPKIEEELTHMTPEERIKDALDILIDWDGCRSYRSLGALVDEIRARLGYEDFMSQSYIDDKHDFWIKNKIEDYIENDKNFLRNIKDLEIGMGNYFIETFSHRDWSTLRQWCSDHDFYTEIISYHHPYGLIDVRIGKNEPI